MEDVLRAKLAHLLHVAAIKYHDEWEGLAFSSVLDDENVESLMQLIKQSNLDLLKRLEDEMQLDHYKIGVPSENLNAQEEGESIVAEKFLDAITRERERLEAGQ